MEHTEKAYKDLGIENACSEFPFVLFTLQDYEMNIMGLETIPSLVNAAGFCVCLQGGAEVLVSGRAYRIKSGDMCCILPKTMLYLLNKSADFKGYVCAAQPDFLTSVHLESAMSLMLHVRENPCVSLSARQQDELLNLCRLLETISVRDAQPHKTDIAKHLAAAILYEVAGIYQSGKIVEKQEFSQKNKYYLSFVALLTEDYAAHRKVDYYAQQLCITPRYLSAVCKELVGLTATEFINNYLIINIRQLLATTEMTILEISDALNFPNPSYFTQFFKKHTGLTPKAFRTANRFKMSG